MEPEPGIPWRASVSLTSGSKLGAYEIQSPLGGAGMGEVYRARDSRLNRESPDASTFIMLKQQAQSSPPEVHVVINWAKELPR